MFTNLSHWTDEQLTGLLTTSQYDAALFAAADSLRRACCGEAVYMRGLIEFTNYCKNDCFYCGIRCGNRRAKRYRLTSDEIMACCREGYDLDFRTFVLQGGEDPYFTDQRICRIVSQIKSTFPDCAVTLSIGEKPRKSYEAYFRAGADRYLLRHETADPRHYRMLHPPAMRLENRKRCLWDLKEIGYQVGSGFMVGAPFQTPAHLVADLRFLQELQPDMIGIGPFLRAAHTPFQSHANGSLALTLRMIAVLRLLFPYALIPATTALGTLSPQGRELGLKAGANVVMPNLSPVSVRALYQLYDNKICTGDQSAQCRYCLENRVKSAGYSLDTSRGDAKRPKEKEA